MITINLLKDHTVRAQKPFAKPEATRTRLAGIAFILIAAIVMGIWYLQVERQITAQTNTRNMLRTQENRLQELRAQIVHFEQQKQQRQNRIDLIEKLKESQSGPVLLLNAIIQGIPEKGDFRLTELEQKTDKVMINGITRKPEAISELMANLAASGIFTSVDLGIVERQDDASKFSLICMNAQKNQAESRHGAR